MTRQWWLGLVAIMVLAAPAAGRANAESTEAPVDHCTLSARGSLQIQPVQEGQAELAVLVVDRLRLPLLPVGQNEIPDHWRTLHEQTVRIEGGLEADARGQIFCRVNSLTQEPETAPVNHIVEQLQRAGAALVGHLPNQQAAAMDLCRRAGLQVVQRNTRGNYLLCKWPANADLDAVLRAFERTQVITYIAPHVKLSAGPPDSPDEYETAAPPTQPTRSTRSTTPRRR